LSWERKEEEKEKGMKKRKIKRREKILIFYNSMSEQYSSNFWLKC
jgi:hypothetical protein